MGKSSEKDLIKQLPFTNFFPENTKYIQLNSNLKHASTQLVTFIKSLQQSDGGFSKSLNETRSETWATGQSVILLLQLN